MIRKVARENQGMKTLREDGVEKVLKGITTIDELTKVAFDYESEETSAPT
jgi:type II secretory ATPase GspE/PulE/Tfp pilus assembly ATPase PilB-like protein